MKYLLASMMFFLGLPGHAQSANHVNTRDYSFFKLIPDRNIFNPNRSARGSGIAKPVDKTPKVDSFALLGTMSYEKGDFAFFGGSKSAYQKVLSPSNSIAGFQIKSVNPDGVQLEKDGKVIDLAVGEQMKRQEEGEWTVSAATSYVQTASAEDSPTRKRGAGSSGGESDALKRLLEKREKELKK
jgi:hypothetical protein